MIKTLRFEGLIAAPFTPMDKSGNINFGIIETYYNFLEKNGVIGAFINGSTGEGPSLTQREKQQQALKWAECYKSGGKVRIINLVGGTSYSECIENAIFSFETGLSAIAIVGPSYFKPCDENLLADFCTRIGESVPEMPVYYYHIPGLTGVCLSMIKFLERISEQLPNFAGIKYSHDDFLDFLACLDFRNHGYEILWGKDEALLSVFMLGCKGGVGSTYNYAAPLYLKMISAFKEGNNVEAGRLQQISVNLVRLLGKYGGIATGKAFMRYAGLDCGEFRSPVRNMTAKMYEDFVKDVELLNMDGLFSKF